MTDAAEENPNDIVVLTIRMPRHLKTKLEGRKDYTGMSMNAIVLHILNVALRTSP